MNTSKYLHYLLYFLYLILFTSIVCSLRAVSSIAIGLILVTSLFKNKVDTNLYVNKHIQNIFLAACCLFYLVQSSSLLHTHNLAETYRLLQLQSSLIIIPFALYSSDYLNPVIYNKLMKHFIWILSAAMLCCFVLAFRRYFFLHAAREVFFYHELVSPFNQNAVLISILLFIGLIHQMEIARKHLITGNSIIHYLLILFFIFCILMLSSKLIIVFLSVYLIYYFALLIKNRSGKSVIIASLFIFISIMMVLFTHNPVSKRFNEIISGNISLVQQQQFSPGIYFNGLQFRLLQWRFVSQILTEKKAWLTGVSLGDAQTLLDKKYISTNMYLGEPGSVNGGFLGYDTHNQFLESALQTGIGGLLAFMFICYGMIRLAIKRKSVELTFVVILLIAYAFNESCFEGQYGLMVFVFFPMFMDRGGWRKGIRGGYWRGELREFNWMVSPVE